MSQLTLTNRAYHNSNLFSSHYLDERIKHRAEWDCDTEAQQAFEELQNLYQLEGSLVEGYKEDDLINNWIDEVLNTLGYGTQVETTLPQGNGYVDILLFENDDKRREAASLYLDTKNTKDLFNNGVTVVEAKQWDADFNKRFSEQRPYRDASHQIKHYLENVENIEWGILTNGRKWRLYGTKDYETKTYYEVDLPELLEQGDLEQFKYFYTFFRPEAFQETAGSTFLEKVWSESETASQELGEDLQDNVFTALRVLGHGFIESNDLDIDPDDTQGLNQLKEQSLVLLYRLMFVLYAESRNLIHPEEQEAVEEYEQNFSLDQLRLSIHDTIGEVDQGFENEYSEYSSTMWRQLEDLFQLIDKGEESLGIPPYNGGLFDREKHEFLAENSVSNQHLAEVIYRLSTTENEEGRYVLADYGDLDTRHLGSVYEGLLEHQFRIAPEDYAAVEEDGGQVWKPATEVTVADAVETVSEGSLYVVNDEGERKATGAYYTPDYVVTYIVEETIDPLIDEIREDLIDQGFDPGTQEYLGPFLRRVTQLKILDPAMGSGHFLTRATGYLTEQVMNEVREVETEMGVAFDEQHIRREIAKECIYGVDLNGMAVELAKLSMWLDTLAADRPLAFLDHHLKTGNSLVGSDVTQVLSNGPSSGDEDGQITLTQALARARQKTLEHVMGQMQELLEIDNETLEDVKSMEEIYDQIREDPLYQRLFELTNVHTAERFGLDVPEDVYEQMAAAIEDKEKWSEIQEEDWFRSAQNHSKDESFFHWELEYPEVFFNENGEKIEHAGFDAVVGNPPYVRQEQLTAAKPYFDGRYKSYNSASDLYMYFIERGYELLRNNQSLGYIVSNKFIHAEYGSKLRSYLADRTTIHRAIDFHSLKVFGQNVSAYPLILIFDKIPAEETHEVTISRMKSLDFDDLRQEVATQRYRTKQSIFTDNDWRIQDPEISKVINTISDGANQLKDYLDFPLRRGLLTGLNEAFILDEEKLLEIDPDREHIYKMLKGRDIQRYYVDYQDRHIISIPSGWTKERANTESETEAWDWFKSEYPNLSDHLSEFKSDAQSRHDRGDCWWELRPCDYYNDLENPKIVYPVISKGPNFAVDTEGYYINDKLYSIPAENYALLAVLNSSLTEFWVQAELSGLRGGYQEFRAVHVEQIPIDESINGHSSLSEMAEELVELRKQLEALNTDLLDHLGTYSDGQTITESGLTQPPSGSSDSALQKTSDNLDSLRVGAVNVDRDSSTSVEIQLTARYKPENKDEYETDQWGYTETDLLPALQINDLSETEIALIEEFVPVAVDEASGFANFRETATKTNSLVDRLRKLTLPELSEIDQRFEGYLKTKERAEELEEKIEETDRQIDETVYELYGLTDEEIEVVEEAINQ